MQKAEKAQDDVRVIQVGRRVRVIKNGVLIYEGPDRRKKKLLRLRRPLRRKRDVLLWLFTWMILLIVSLVLFLTIAVLFRVVRWMGSEERKGGAGDYKLRTDLERTLEEMQPRDEEVSLPVLGDTLRPWHEVFIDWQQPDGYKNRDIYYVVRITEFRGPPFTGCHSTPKRIIERETSENIVSICDWCAEFPNGKALVEVKTLINDCDSQTETCETAWSDPLYIPGYCGQQDAATQSVAKVMRPVLNSMTAGGKNPFHTEDIDARIAASREELKNKISAALDRN